MGEAQEPPSNLNLPLTPKVYSAAPSKGRRPASLSMVRVALGLAIDTISAEGAACPDIKRIVKTANSRDMFKVGPWTVGPDSYHENSTWKRIQRR